MTTLATHQQARLSGLVHAAVDSVPTHHTVTTFGPDKVFIAAVYDRLVELAPDDMAGVTLAHLQEWLLEARRVVDGTRVPLVTLARCDLVAAVDYTSLRRSECTAPGGGDFHFVLRHSAAHAYQPLR